MRLPKVRSEYFDMYQLKYNDKAEILPEDESVQTKIAQLVFYDPIINLRF